MTTSSEWNQSYRKKSFNWTISTQYTQQYYHLFQTFNMPWRRGTARILRGLPIQISRLIRTTYSVIYWHLCTIPLLQKITFVDRHVAIASRHLLLLLSLLERNLLLDVWEPPWQGATFRLFMATSISARQPQSVQGNLNLCRATSICAGQPQSVQSNLNLCKRTSIHAKEPQFVQRKKPRK